MEKEMFYIMIIAVITIYIILVYFDDKKNKREEEKRKCLEEKYKINQEEISKAKRKKERLNWNKKIKKELSIKQLIYPNKKIEVLVADYNSGMITITDSILESMGIETQLVKSGYDILDLIEDGNKYDAIITNNIFRDCPDSYVILNKLKEKEEFNIPVIILTVSMNQRNHFVNDLGFNEYIEKPLSIDKAEKALCSVIKDLKFTKNKK